jgi:hypothetical protein
MQKNACQHAAPFPDDKSVDPLQVTVNSYHSKDFTVVSQSLSVPGSAIY